MPDPYDYLKWLVGVSTLVRAHLFFKVEIEHGEEESPEKIGEEIGRQLRKLYVVRSVELSSVVREEG